MSQFSITPLGAASVLIEIDQTRVLVDPFFSSKYWNRLRHIDVLQRDWSDLEAIVITEGHRLHLDLFSFKYFSLHTAIYVPQGLGAFLKKYIPNPVFEVSTWSTASSKHAHFIALPQKRPFFLPLSPRLRAHASWIIQKGNIQVFVSGRSLYGDHYQQISNLYALDAAILYLKPPQRLHFMSEFGLDLKDFGKAAQDLKARHLFPYPYDIFHEVEKINDFPGIAAALAPEDQHRLHLALFNEKFDLSLE